LLIGAGFGIGMKLLLNEQKRAENQHYPFYLQWNYF